MLHLHRQGRKQDTAKGQHTSPCVMTYYVIFLLHLECRATRTGAGLVRSHAASTASYGNPRDRGQHRCTSRSVPSAPRASLATAGRATTSRVRMGQEEGWVSPASETTGKRKAFAPRSGLAAGLGQDGQRDGAGGQRQQLLEGDADLVLEDLAGVVELLDEFGLEALHGRVGQELAERGLLERVAQRLGNLLRLINVHKLGVDVETREEDLELVVSAAVEVGGGDDVVAGVGEGGDGDELGALAGGGC